ncbi:MAG: hypothetical protein ACYC4S_09895 [Rhodoferax sp.]
MTNIEKRLEQLESLESTVRVPNIVAHFICPARGTVSVLHIASGLKIERRDDEDEVQFLARVRE